MGKWSRRAFITAGVAAGGIVVFGVAIRRGDLSPRTAALVAGEGDSLFDVWLKISPDNTLTAIIPHAEMGQGVHTTLAMMLADELDADWSTMRFIEAPAVGQYANYTLGRGFVLGDADIPGWLIDSVDGLFHTITRSIKLQVTGGSMSVRMTGQIAMRVTGAATRAVLLEAAARRWRVDAADLVARDSRVWDASGDRSATFAELAPAAAELPLPDKPALKDSSTFRIMGTSVPRWDIPPKVDGSADFAIDVRLPGMKHAAVMAAPVFGDSVVSVEPSSVHDMPGVRKVVNLGDAVAVIADGYWQARQALNRLDVRFGGSGNENREQGDIFRQFATALDTGKPRSDHKTGDAEAVLAAADDIIDAEYRVPYLAHATMEPMNCTAWVHDGHCELWTGSQNPLEFAHAAAKALGLKTSQVTVHNQYLGGGFGRRAFADVAVQAARIAGEVSYPVKLVWSREEDTRHDHYRQASISRFQATLDADGRPTAWHNVYVNKYDPEEAPHIPYAINSQRIAYVESETPVPWGFWRSVDHSLHAFFTESFIDELAHAAGRDPYEYRRELLAGQPRMLAVLDLAAEKGNWGDARKANEGRGIAIHRSFGTIVAQVVDVAIVDGKARCKRVVCAVDPGFAIHPDGLAAQMESGIVYGLTAALYGEISIRRGAVAQSNFHDYPMLRMDEAPDIETHVINGGGTLGGGGEPGTPPIAPALANAIFDASGLRIRELPVSRHELGATGREQQDVA